MYCRKCGAEISESDRLCRNCGVQRSLARSAPLEHGREARTAALEIASPLIVIAFSVFALGVYLSRYKLALDATWSTVAAFSGLAWLHLHVAFYLISYSLFLAAGFLAILITITGNIPRVDWVALSTCAATVFLALGIGSGAMFARVVWGIYFAWDPKTSLALVNGLLCVFVIAPVVFWLPKRSRSHGPFLPSGVTSKPAIWGHFKTGHVN